MLLSIIIPAHNVERYIENCINSFQSREPFEYEILIVENGSSDRTFDLCKSLSVDNKKIRLFKLDRPGVSNARNFGLSKAKGEYIWFVDGDDFIEATALDTIVKYILHQQRSSLPFDILIFGYNIIGKGTIPAKHTYLNKEINKIDAINGLYDSAQWSGFVWNKLYRRAAIKSLFHIDIHMAEDLLFNTELFLSAERIYSTDRVLYNYRMNDTSISSNFSEKKLSSFIAYEEIIGLLNDEPTYSYPLRIINCAKADFSRQILMHYYNTDRKVYLRVRKKYKNIVKQNIRYYSSLTSKIGAFLTIYFPYILNQIRLGK